MELKRPHIDSKRPLMELERSYKDQEKASFGSVKVSNGKKGTFKN